MAVLFDNEEDSNHLNTQHSPQDKNVRPIRIQLCKTLEIRPHIFPATRRNHKYSDLYNRNSKLESATKTGVKLTNLSAESIFEQCISSFQNIIGDFGGGSPVPKTFLMSYLAQEEKLRNFLELGVYRGKSLFPVAYSVYLNGGQTVGVDAFDYKTALENDVTEEKKIAIEKFFEKLDLEEIYRDLLVYKEGCSFGQTIQVIRQTTDSFFCSTNVANKEFDLVHIDANHDTMYVDRDYKNSLEHIKQGGFFVFDDIDWPSVNVVFQEAKQNNPVVFECETFGVLLHEKPSLSRNIKVEQITKKLNSVYKQVSRLSERNSEYRTTISVGVMTYNQVDTIEQCLESIVNQSGDFTLKIVIADDNSNDGTSEVIKDYISRCTSQDISFDYIRNDINLGVMKNLEMLSQHCIDTDYVSFIEGDDYYFSGDRLSSHLEIHKRNPDITMSFNGLLILEETGARSKFLVWDGPENLDGLKTKDLVLKNHVGNLGAMFFNSNVLGHLEGSYEMMFVGDWFHSILCSEYGRVYKLAAPLSVYRKNGKGYWTSKSAEAAAEFLTINLERLNSYLNFTFDKEVTLAKRAVNPNHPLTTEKSISMLIVDDIFPHPGSGFRLEEFSEILKKIPDSEIITTGESCHLLGNDGVEELLIAYKRMNPELANRVHLRDSSDDLQPKILYCDFLGNAYHNLLPLSEASNTPFVFTLYPGGSFAMDNKQSDEALSKVMTSPHFKKVIVTQINVRDYLLRKNLCPPEKIELIWGVVVPKENLERSVDKVRFGYEKDTLDLCFVAHQYTPTGSDKGFDTFLQTAKILSKQFENINFHIVGPWRKGDHNLVGIKNLNFYGVLSQEDLNEFYRDKDAIVSPNKPNQIVHGSFDGFPTAAVTDASLRRVAMITTDPLNLNDGFFVDGKEIAIVSNNPKAIAANIEYFIKNPSALASIADNGYIKSNFLYSEERQSEKRVALFLQTLAELESEIEMKPSQPIPEEIPTKKRILLGVVKKLVPRILKRGVRKLMRLWVRMKAV
jgi:glycosyltransferase involved in cell wall biosynthesis/predicted O-methyltransferase YrrM